MKKIDNFNELDQEQSRPQRGPSPNMGKDRINPGTHIKPVNPDEMTEQERDQANREIDENK